MSCYLTSLPSWRDPSRNGFGSYFSRFFHPSPKTGLRSFALSAALLFATPLWALSPQIYSLAPAYGGVGTSVSISGAYFGTARGTVKFYTTVATTITSWTASSITVQVPTGATTGPVVVTTANLLSSNGVTFTVTTPTSPTITNLSPAFAVVGTSATITGRNFGTTRGSVRFLGVPGAPISNWTDTSITAQVPMGAATGPVTVTANGMTSNGVTFSVIPSPIIGLLSP